MANEFAYYQKLKRSQQTDSPKFMMDNGVFMNGTELYTDVKMAEDEKCELPFRKITEDGNVLDYDVINETAKDTMAFIVSLNSEDYEKDAIILDMDKISLMGQDIGEKLYQAAVQELGLEQNQITHQQKEIDLTA